MVGPARTARPTAAVWLPAGAAPVSIGGYPVGGGLLYVGRGLTGAYTTATEPAAIDPALPVSLGHPETPGTAHTRHPSYEDLTPGGRAGYLEWLARGRTGRTEIDHVLLFFFGLERRVLVDLAATRDGHQEYEHIAAEVRRLRATYGADEDLVARANRFLELVDTLAKVSEPDLRPPGTPADPTRDLPVSLRVGIGRYAAARRPLSARWAYAWHAHHPDRGWRETATEHPDEFRAAFVALYTESFPDGGMTLPLAANDDLTLTYQPASPGFAGRSLRVHTRVPDIRRMVAPVRQLHAIAALVQDDLEVERERRESTMASAIALLHLAAIVAPAGGRWSDATLREQVADALQLGPDQRDELAAVPARPRRTALVDAHRQFAQVPHAQRAAAADLLIAVAGADGTLTPAEQRILGEVFPLLGLDPGELDGRVRELVSTMDEPDDDDTIILDLALVNRKISEAAPMATLLSGLLANPTPG
ncbi:TerB N-terminal domain-containing protein [Rhizomonospora bruguierae]|uniref:TerB N-terminal domain-containing protein n=1 Tax=Rhizomonospora bruguierae TaxID=1581705 RepID=UPI00278BBF43|nr:TerB N-terminal domain-containing protein [Micromonospora sp. NBRC 107566]